MERVHALPRSARQGAMPTLANAMTRVDIALCNGFALPKVAALIEIFHKANVLNAAQR
ncbi:MAG: AraC family transcriptional regulator, partial [Kiritimatiellae bacterium]|nr:AraC family transcriptional regulator [Kiritimatiellia bacterium]